MLDVIDFVHYKAKVKRLTLTLHVLNRTSNPQTSLLIDVSAMNFTATVLHILDSI